MKVHDALQDWPRIILGRNLVESIQIDNGPHSMTRVQLRLRLMADAKGTNDVKRANAITILKFTKEKGVLMALRSEPAPLGDLAQAGVLRGHVSEDDRRVGARVAQVRRRSTRARAPAGFGGSNVIPIPH